MTIRLTFDAASRVSAVAEALLSPAPGSGLEAWWQVVEERLRALFPGAHLMLSRPAAGRVANESGSLDRAALDRVSTFTAIDPRTGRFFNHDPVIAAWLAHRHGRGIDAWTGRTAARLLERHGLSLQRSAFY